jgi:O-antigen biosynthesis protein
MKASIILPNYCPNDEVRGYCMDFLESLDKHTDREKYQFVVVENGSYTKELEDRADIYIHKDKPMGYARAVNLGLAVSDHDTLLIMNNDLVLPEKWLEILTDDYQGGILAPLDDQWRNPEKRIYEDAHWFSLVMMDRHTFSRVGYLDESLPYRFHDQDYSIRVKKLGFPVRRTGNLIVKHINMATYNAMGRPQDREEEAEMRRRHKATTFDEWNKTNYESSSFDNSL